MLSRREFLKLVGAAGAGLALPGSGCARREDGVLVNDTHSQLNPTRVRRDVAVDSVESLQTTVQAARREGRAISIAAAGMLWVVSSSAPTLC